MRHKNKIFLVLLILSLVYLAFVQNSYFTKATSLPVVSTCDRVVTHRAATSGDKVYPALRDCMVKYNGTTTGNANYSAHAHAVLQEQRFVRGVLVYFPADQYDYFEQELKWLYRSWIEMQKYEPKKWRTDLVVFTNTIKLKSGHVFTELNCSKENTRRSKEDRPMCTIIDYVPVKDRMVLTKKPDPVSQTVEEEYEQLYKYTDVFDEDTERFWSFYTKLQQLKTYGYIDSILMAFEGYSYLKQNFDFLLRTDMDVFLTPLFAKWLPVNCNDFIVGGGGYSHDFNMKRLKRAATNLKLKFNNIRNLGSTWYSTPAQFRLAAYFTLVSMVYVSNEEFSEPERMGKVGTILWPEWHYGVLLLYGQNLAMNHLITSGYINVTKLDTLIDYPSSNAESVNEKVHIHVYHGENVFSKFAFRDGHYNNITIDDLAKYDKTRVKYYTLSIAIESKLLKPSDLSKLLQWITNTKT